MGKSARRGRRRQAGAREPNGRLSRSATPAEAENKAGATPEVIKRRAILAGPDGDPDHTSTVLDILYTRGVLDQDQWQTARRYAYCRNVLFGCPDAPATGGRQAGREISDGALRHLQEDFVVLVQALTGADWVELSHEERSLVKRLTGQELARVKAPLGQGARKRTLDEVLIYNRMPHWLAVHLGLRQKPRPGDGRQKMRFLEAIGDMTFAMGRHRARRKVSGFMAGVTSAQAAPPVPVAELPLAARVLASTVAAA